MRAAALQLTVVRADGGGGVRTYAPYLCRFRVDLIESDAERRCSSLRWSEPILEAACVHVRPTYVGSGWISSDPMRRGSASAYGGRSRWWRRCAYMCAPYLCWFQVDLIGFNVERRHSSLRWLEPMVEAACVYVQPTYVGSEWTSSDPMRRGGTPAYSDQSRWWGSVLTCAPYLCRSGWISLDPMRRGGAPAYGGRSRWWRRRAYMCALPMSVLGGSRRI
jgi:hypothetical protein